MTVSAGSSISLEDIADKEPNLIKWFQLFVYRDRTITYDLIERAESKGYKAIVITVDFPVCGIRYHNMHNNYEDKTERANYNKYNVKKDVAADATWTDLQLIRAKTRLPVVVKGIMTAEDARLAVNCGANGIIVSNHGGRQLDDSPSTVM